jgi:hypothetical protein
MISALSVAVKNGPLPWSGGAGRVCGVLYQHIFDSFQGLGKVLYAY